MKSQFPKDSGIMVSGVVKINSYDGQITLDKPTYSITDYEITEKQNLNLAFFQIVVIIYYKWQLQLHYSYI